MRILVLMALFILIWVVGGILSCLGTDNETPADTSGPPVGRADFSAGYGLACGIQDPNSYDER